MYVFFGLDYTVICLIFYIQLLSSDRLAVYIKDILQKTEKKQGGEESVQFFQIPTSMYHIYLFDCLILY